MADSNETGRTTLDLIADALKHVEDEDRVYYGTASKLPQGEPWNYTVFSRIVTSPNGNNTSFTDAYEVAIVREGFVPEGMDKTVIAAMRTVPGMKLDASHDIEYVPQAKQGTRDPVEMMIIRFVKGRKP